MGGATVVTGKMEAVGMEAVTMEAVGMEAVGMEAVIMEAVIMEAVGMEAVGMEAVGMEAVGMEAVTMEIWDVTTFLSMTPYTTFETACGYIWTDCGQSFVHTSMVHVCQRMVPCAWKLYSLTNVGLVSFALPRDQTDCCHFHYLQINHSYSHILLL